MVTTIDKIREKLKLKYREVNPETIDLIVKLYFETGKSLISAMDKPEVAFVWGTMRPYISKVQSRIWNLKQKEPTVIRQAKLKKLERFLELGSVAKTGKISTKYLKYGNERID